MRRFIVNGAGIVLLALLTVLSAAAQLPPPDNPPDNPTEYESYQGEISGGYSYLHARPAGGFPYFSLEGWDITATQWGTSWFGMGIDLSGHYGNGTLTTPGGPVKNNLNQYGFLGGPRFRVYRQKKFDVSFQGLVGAGYGHTPLPNMEGLAPKDHEARWAFALAIPLNYNINSQVAVRVAPYYYQTRFGPSSQHDIMFTTAIVYRFAKSEQ